MSCERIRPDLSLLGTGELEPRDEAEIVRHLDRCADCRATEAEERALDALLAQWTPSPPRRDIGGALLEAVARAPVPGDDAPVRSLLPRRRSRAPIAAAAAALLFAVPLLFRGRPAERPDPDVSVAAVDDLLDRVPIGSGLTGLALPPRDPFRR